MAFAAAVAGALLLNLLPAGIRGATGEGDQTERGHDLDSVGQLRLRRGPGNRVPVHRKEQKLFAPDVHSLPELCR